MDLKVDLNGRWRTVGVACVLGAAAMGCGQGQGAAEPTERRESALLSFEWRDGWSQRPFHGNISTDPAICGNHPGSSVTFGLDDGDHKYYASVTVHPGTSDWSVVGSKTFLTSPSCVFESPYRYATPPSDLKLLVAGKVSTDNKLYVAPGHLTTGNPVPGPTWDSMWTEVKATGESTSPVYTGNYGRPSLASNTSLIVLAFLDSDGKIHARTRATPYASNTWSVVKNGPALPSGATSDGIPAVVYDRGPNASPVNKFIIFVTAYSTGFGGNRLYWTTFDGNSTWGSWTEAPIFNNIKSDPGLEYDDQSDALTLYFKTDDTTVLTVSTPRAEDIGQYMTDALGHNTVGAVAAPRAVFGGGYESGVRTAVTRGWIGTAATDTLLWDEDYQDSPFFPYVKLQRSGALCADGGNGVEAFGANPNNNVAGCNGSVTWDHRATLCAPGSRPCTSAEWNAARGSAVPTHDYWTDDVLRKSGTTSNACYASKTTGTTCQTNKPMHVCSASGADAEGNTCAIHGCGFNANTPNQYYGGCNNPTAGTLCCLAVQ